MIEMCDGFESACTADSRQHRFGHAFGNAPSYLDMGKIEFHSFNLYVKLNYEGFQSL